MKTIRHNSLCLLLVLCAMLVISQATYAGQDDPDWANTCGAATFTPTNLNWRYYGTIDYPGDVDFIKLENIPTNRSLKLYTESQSVDPKGALYNSSCQKVREDFDSWTRISPNDFIIWYPALAGETYYLAISGQSAVSTGNYKIEIRYAAPPGPVYNITASGGAGGSISPLGSMNFNEGSSQSYTITPDSCYTADVVVDGVSQGNITSYDFNNITANHTISATFTSTPNLSITAGAGAGGRISFAGDTVPLNGSITVPCGMTLSYDIVPDTDYRVLDVSVDGVPQGAITSYSFNDIQANHTISATFTEATNYIITTIAGSGGSISPSGPLMVTEGAGQTFTITPDAGYQVAVVMVDGLSQGAVTSYPLSNVISDHVIEAQFIVESASPPECLDVSDAPLDSTFQAAPANVMFLLDDSGSMDFEVMTPETNTEFNIPGLPTNANKVYVFNDPGDNTYSIYTQGILGAQRKYWKSQWSGYNSMYYNPHVTYVPWPNKGPADTKTPRSHPQHATYTFDITQEYYKLTVGQEVTVDDGDSGFSTPDGVWETITADTAAQGNDWRRTTLLAERKWAEWRPNLIPDTYDVYARWVADAVNHDVDVEYQIYANGTNKEAEIEVDQRDNGSEWRLLGRYDFTADGFVRLELDDYESGSKQACADAVRFVPAGDSLSITRAHYYTWLDEDFNGELNGTEPVYLVNFVDSNADGALDRRDWYLFIDVNSNAKVDLNELTYIPNPDPNVPSILRQRTTAEDLQNWANWYSYYRKRELTAIGAIATVITQVQGMNIGFYSIHERIKQPVLPVHVDGLDETNTLLNILYTQFNSNYNTPLRHALINVGKYFHQDDGDPGKLGDSPFAAAEDGGECQQCFTIMMTDGAYNGEEPFDPAVDYDGDNGEPYADAYSNTLADIAMYYYENDLSSGLGDEVPTTTWDTASHQHMVTYGVGFGLNGDLVLADYNSDRTSTDYLKCLAAGASCTEGDYPPWPDPAAGNEPEKVDDMWHATVNGRGRYLEASNAVELINDFMLILKDIELYSGSASAVAVNGDELYSKVNSQTRLYQSKYYNQSWHGDILSFTVNDVTGEPVKPAVWSAAKMLSSKQAASRLIATYDGSSSGTPFRYADLTNLQRSHLDPGWSSDATLATNIVGYLRGDPANEQDNGGNFRNRSWTIADPDHPNNGEVIISSKLGDIVHSSPVFNNDVIYAGANDGMLHAFDADTGEEIFAYVPNLLFENLVWLAGIGYTHKYYVDQSPTVSKLEISGSWTTMLIGGLGKGGRGYYALDVSTMPTDEDGAADMVMWEYPNLGTDAGEVDDMGYSFSRAEVVRSYDTNYPWIVFFGNGYNSTNGKAVLFILDPSDGTLIKRIDTLVDGCNGLSSPTPVDVDGDDIVDYVYAGDLKGNLWKFDLTSDNANNWDVAFDESGTPKPLFTATNQPITTRPDVMRHCSIEKEGYMVLFGTGKLLGESDINNTSQQTVYGIWDYGDDVDDGEYVGSRNATDIANTNLPGTVSLLEQSFESYVNVADIRVLSENPPGRPDWRTTTTDGGTCGENAGATSCDPNGSGANPDPLRDVGWYIDLPGNGERVIADVLVREGRLIVISYTPEGSRCSTGGSSWVMQMDACSGARLASVIFDRNDDGVINEQDMVDIDPTADEELAVVTGKKISGRLQSPAIIGLGNNVEKMYMSSSRGKIETMLQRAAKLGVIYWRIFSQAPQ